MNATSERVMRGAEAAGRRGKRLDGSLRFLASGEKPRLEGKSNLLRMRQEIPLSDAELPALDEGVSALESLLSRLANVATRDCTTFQRDLLHYDRRTFSLIE